MIEAIADTTLLQKYILYKDADAFSELIRRYAGLVYGTCLRVTHNPTDADDIAQECFLEFARKAHSIKVPVPVWLYTLSRSRALNFIRGSVRRKKREQVSSDPDTGERSEPAWSELEPVIDDAIDQLPDKYKEPLILHYLEGVSQTEISQRLGINQSTVCRRIEKALGMVRKLLKKAGFAGSVAIIASLLNQNAAVAVPASLTSSLGKIAISGIGHTVKITPFLKPASSLGRFVRDISALILALIVTWGIFAFLGNNITTNSGVNPPGIELATDYRFEVLSLIELLSEKPEFTRDSPLLEGYRETILSAFSNMKSHKAVKQLQTVQRFDLSHKALSKLAFSMNLSDYKEGESRLSYSGAIPPEVKDIAPMILDFERESGFAQFYENNLNKYAAARDTLQRIVDQMHIARFIDYLGEAPSTVKVIVSLLGHCRGVIHVVDKDGNTHTRFVWEYDGNEEDHELFSEALLFAIAHSSASRLVDDNIEHFSKSSGLYSRMQNRLEPEGCGDWVSCLKVHLSHAIVARYYLEQSRPEKSSSYAQKYTEKGYLYLDSISQILKEYENKRRRYHSLSDFARILANRLEQTPPK